MWVRLLSPPRNGTLGMKVRVHGGPNPKWVLGDGRGDMRMQEREREMRTHAKYSERAFGQS